jgi:hypothetical protein
LPKYIKFTSNPNDSNVETLRQNIRLGKLRKHDFSSKLEKVEMKDILSKVYIPNQDTTFFVDSKVKANNRYLGDQKIFTAEKLAKLNYNSIDLHHLYSNATIDYKDEVHHLPNEAKAEKLDSNLIRY